MAVIFNESEVAHETHENGASVQRLITPNRTGSDKVKTARWHVPAGIKIDFSVAETDLAWAHVLMGEVLIVTDQGTRILTKDHFILLPPSLSAQITSTEGAIIFRAEVQNAQRFDDNWEPKNLTFRCVDWTEEPLLNSEFDARKRIYMLTPQLSGTKAAKGEMILYPPGTEAANHHHEGAEHFQVILRGSATFHLNEVPHKVKAGDTIYIYENERHFIINDGNEELAFIEYFVPGTYNTVWAENAPICTWNPSGMNIKGGRPTREIGAHSSAEAHSRSDL